MLVCSPATCLSSEAVPIADRLNGAGETIVDVTDETCIVEVVREAGGTADILVYVVGLHRRCTDIPGL